MILQEPAWDKAVTNEIENKNVFLSFQIKFEASQRRRVHECTDGLFGTNFFTHAEQNHIIVIT